MVLHWLEIYKMENVWDGQFNWKTNFFGFIFTPWNRIKIFYETEIVWF